MMNMLVGVLVEVIKTVSEIEREQPLVAQVGSLRCSAVDTVFGSTRTDLLKA